jgi:hypothetical protein
LYRVQQSTTSATWNPAWERVELEVLPFGWESDDPRWTVIYEFRRTADADTETHVFSDLTKEEYEAHIDQKLNWLGGDPGPLQADS